MRFIAAIMTAYYVGLILFYFVPAAGPYYLAAHDPLAQKYLEGGEIQFARMLDAFRMHHSIAMISSDYFIAFPCLHIAQPLIVLWYLRDWKRVALVLGLYDVVLVPSILLLQQHYVVDLVGGVGVAALAVFMVRDGPAEKQCV